MAYFVFFQDAFRRAVNERDEIQKRLENANKRVNELEKELKDVHVSSNNRQTESQTHITILEKQKESMQATLLSMQKKMENNEKIFQNKFNETKTLIDTKDQQINELHQKLEVLQHNDDADKSMMDIEIKKLKANTQQQVQRHEAVLKRKLTEAYARSRSDKIKVQEVEARMKSLSDEMEVLRKSEAKCRKQLRDSRRREGRHVAETQRITTRLQNVHEELTTVTMHFK